MPSIGSSLVGVVHFFTLQGVLLCTRRLPPRKVPALKPPPQANGSGSKIAASFLLDSSKKTTTGRAPPDLDRPWLLTKFLGARQKGTDVLSGASFGGNALKLKRVTILFIDEGGGGAREFMMPGALLPALVLSLILLAVSFVWIFLDHRALKPWTAQLKEIEILSAHDANQVAYLGKRVQGLREKLEYLDTYDRQLREIARVATGDEGRSVVGVGGSDPKAISARLTDKDPEPPILRKAPEVKSENKVMEEGHGLFEFISPVHHLAGSKDVQWPTRGWVCGDFGSRPSPNKNQRAFNQGVDIATRADAPVRAPASGVVTAVDYREGYGRRVVLAHGFGLVSVFSNLGKVQVNKGDRLRQGDAIATVDGTGRIKGSCLHYEFHVYGVPVDPRLSTVSVAHEQAHRLFP
jgi:murein DD-endopeptidase MepM/ murein hydrolase activator NlpD